MSGIVEYSVTETGLFFYGPPLFLSSRFDGGTDDVKEVFGFLAQQVSDADGHIQIPGLCAALTGFAHPFETQYLSLLHIGGNIDGQGLAGLFARIFHLPAGAGLIGGQRKRIVDICTLHRQFDAPFLFQTIADEFSQRPVKQRLPSCLRLCALPASESADKHASKDAGLPEFKGPVSGAVGFPENIVKAPETEGATHLFKDLLDVRPAENVLFGMGLPILPIKPMSRRHLSGHHSLFSFEDRKGRRRLR